MSRTFATDRNRAYDDTVATIIALDLVLQDMPRLDREEFEGRLERHGAPLITATSLRALARELPFPAAETIDETADEN